MVDHGLGWWAVPEVSGEDFRRGEEWRTRRPRYLRRGRVTFLLENTALGSAVGAGSTRSPLAAEARTGPSPLHSYRQVRRFAARIGRDPRAVGLRQGIELDGEGRGDPLGQATVPWIGIRTTRGRSARRCSQGCRRDGSCSPGLGSSDRGRYLPRLYRTRRRRACT